MWRNADQPAGPSSETGSVYRRMMKEPPEAELANY